MTEEGVRLTRIETKLDNLIDAFSDHRVMVAEQIGKTVTHDELTASRRSTVALTSGIMAFLVGLGSLVVTVATVGPPF